MTSSSAREPGGGPGAAADASGSSGSTGSSDSADSAELDRRMRAQPANERMLAWLRAGPDDRLRPWYGDSRDEGGVVLFERYGAGLPDTCKWSLGVNNVLVHPATGLLFAVHWGRFTFLLRQTGAPGRPNDVAETLDGSVDLRPLEGEWWDWWFEDDEDVAALLQAYALAAHA